MKAVGPRIEVTETKNKCTWIIEGGCNDSHECGPSHKAMKIGLDGQM